MNKSLKSRFKTNLVKLRKAEGLTQEKLAKELNIKRCVIGAYEEGRATPDFDRLIKIADFFKVSIDDLLVVKL